MFSNLKPIKIGHICVTSIIVQNESTQNSIATFILRVALTELNFCTLVHEPLKMLELARARKAPACLLDEIYDLYSQSSSFSK